MSVKPQVRECPRCEGSGWVPYMPDMKHDPLATMLYAQWEDCLECRGLGRVWR